MRADSSASCPYLREERMKKGNLECGGSTPLLKMEEELTAEDVKLLNNWNRLIKEWYGIRRRNIANRKKKKEKL